MGILAVHDKYAPRRSVHPLERVATECPPRYPFNRKVYSLVDTHAPLLQHGPVKPERNYCVPPLERFDLDEVLGLVRSERYFVLHAPRRTGKTSSLLALRDLLKGGAEGDYRCAYINVETAQTAREDVGAAMGAIAVQMAAEAEDALGEIAFAEEVLAYDTTRHPHSALWTLLRKWTRAAKPPLVLLIDEIDALVGDSLVSVLRQLRTGYAQRPASFPQSVILCGVRDVRDYRRWRRTQTGGQPWLVNALARQLRFRRERLLLRGRSISERDVFDAAEAGSSRSTRSGASGWTCWSSGRRPTGARAGSSWSARWRGRGAPMRGRSSGGWSRPRPTCICAELTPAIWWTKLNAGSLFAFLSATLDIRYHVWHGGVSKAPITVRGEHV